MSVNTAPESSFEHIRNCDNCHNSLISTEKGIFCRPCFTLRKQDICELVTSTGIIIFTTENIHQLKAILGQTEISVRLDLHGVLDTTDNTVIFDHPDRMCCISFVGSTTKTRISARKDIISRLGYQISYGILVFSRGGNSYHKVGGKAWMILWIIMNQQDD